MYKKKYNSSLENCKKKKELRATNKRKIKYRFWWVVKLIAINYYMDLFHYLFYSIFVALSWPVDFTESLFIYLISFQKRAIVTLIGVNLENNFLFKLLPNYK